MMRKNLRKKKSKRKKLLNIFKKERKIKEGLKLKINLYLYN